MQKTILILANSIRHEPNRCIAGREVTYDAVSDALRIGDWLRPISQHGEGEVASHESICTDGIQPAVLDIVTLSVGRNAETPYQPENHFIDARTRWVRQRRVLPDLSAVVERPQDLWIQPEAKSDRVNDTHLATRQGVRSLYLIRPLNLTFRIWEETNRFEGGPRRRRRAVFDYNGRRYDLPITDPTMEQRYFTPFPPHGAPARIVHPRDPGRCLLVVSLSAPFRDGNRYKIAATVIEY
jgi:hypothetical protein